MFSSHTPRKPKHISNIVSITFADVFCLLLTGKRVAARSSIKLCTKLLDVPKRNIGLLPFRFHRFKMAIVCMTLLQQTLKSVTCLIIIYNYYILDFKKVIYFSSSSTFFKNSFVNPIELFFVYSEKPL